MKKIIYIILLTCFVAVSCNSKKKATKTQNETAVSENNNNYKATDTVATIEKSACYGTCPVYTLIVLGDGTAHYYGKQHVDKIGHYVVKGGVERLQKLMDEAQKIGYFDMKDKYDGSVTDLPSTVTSLMDEKGEVKTIYSRYGYPKELKAFHKFFEELYNVDWKKIK